MTALGKCEVCQTNDAIGVACTSMPYSCAFCAECAERGADPAIVFICFYDDFGIEFDKLSCPDDLTTFHDGRYMSYREWATLRDAAGIKPQQNYPEEDHGDDTIR